MTYISRELDKIIKKIIDNEYQLDTNSQGKDLLKLDLEEIYRKDKKYQYDHVKNLEDDLRYCHNLLSKFEGSK
jgi:ATP sulfurylase